MSATVRRRVAASDGSSVCRNDSDMPSSTSFKLDVPPVCIGSEVEISFWIKSFFLLFFCALYICTIRNTCTYNTDNKSDTGLEFSHSRARVHLQRVTELGPRPAGSYANEISAADYLRRELLKIVNLAEKSGIKAVFDEQISNYSSFQAGYHVSTYDNVRNFLLRLEGSLPHRKLEKKRAFLVNCHYDSAVESPGASDDFVSCAVMLEVCRILALNGTRLTNDVIFLFNGAEESILLSSHAFITQHPWAKDVAAFLNLEGAGSGGRLMVFQSGPGSDAEFLVNTYSDSFMQPYANVFAEELFQYGFIPSDTDFRIFRDFGQVPGLDMAYTSDGYCYHTPFDTESRITEACLQTTGNDILAFIRRVGQDKLLQSISKLESKTDSRHGSEIVNSFLSSDDIDQSYRPIATVKTSSWSRRVYFDLLGKHFISVPWKWWKVIDWILLIAVVTRFFLHRRLNGNRWIGFAVALVLQLCGQLFGVMFACVLGYVTHEYGCRMSWYSARYNLIGIYLLPFICWFFWFFSLMVSVPNGVLFRCSKINDLFQPIGWVISKKKNHLLIERDFFDSGIFVISFHLLVFDLFNSPAAFVSTTWLASVLIGRVVYQMLPSHSLNSIRWTVLILIPACFCWHFYFCASVIEFFIPVFGRSGQNVRPDVALSVCLFYLISPLTLLSTGMMQCTSVSTAKTLRLVLLNACISYAVLVHASPYGFPYTVSSVSPIDDPSISPRFQRVAIFHTDRSFRDEAEAGIVTKNDSFISVIPLDANEIRFIKPHSYPATIPSSIFSFFQRDDSFPDEFGGLSELVNASSVPCDRSRPYCGLPSLYPYMHLLQTFYRISALPHFSTPGVHLKMIYRTVLNNSLLSSNRTAVNLTLTVTSGPPHTHLLIRTSVPDVRLSSWSFSSIFPVPVPMPLPRKDQFSGHTGAHYFVYHLNAEVRNASQDWTKPWVFWLGFDFAYHTVEPSVDLAATGIYVGDKFNSCHSPNLEDVVSRLPPWITTMRGCASYEHYRFRLK